MAIKSGSGSASLMLANESRSGLRGREDNGQLLPGEKRGVGAVVRVRDGRGRVGGSGLPGRALTPRNYGIEETETHGNPASYRGACLDTTPWPRRPGGQGPGSVTGYESPPPASRILVTGPGVAGTHPAPDPGIT